MLLSQYLKIDISSLCNITGSTVCIFIMLQLAIWYPLLSGAQDDLERHIKRKERAETEWQKIQGQANRLKGMTFLNEVWVSHHIFSEKNAVPTQWFIEGTAGLIEWQTLLEKVEEHVALGMQSVHWQRLPNGQWQGCLLFDIKIPKANREYHNWLPTKLRSYPFVEKDWQVLSTMRVGENASALLEYKQQRHWVRQGSWLPSAGLTVDTVTFDQVTLMTKEGSQIALTVRKIGDMDD
ncbi:hypothetical protein MUS1_06455 [Marinomonas ushuaiensis DSM 15871]|uniref:Uncharacterized protein n=1 Tax=Marinomonas ushuaiensis DSM 15871 TaxID=1122207 RepID=X7E396_9GAMM|nr:hypothetical protein [Marinomonas ushuaiensis]ETX09653.1 hypothetical protein MUS1_06455 [Marinomonas ushuaiensis DSM 15871]